LFRFDEKTYQHLKLARLALPEMERFVADWYAVRVENAAERQASVDDLNRILRDTDQEAIRELGANPLLLTIIALVHRIDAVLPDERVVLYQKCTETRLSSG
jgi:predicted NACHT family NTPase